MTSVRTTQPWPIRKINGLALAECHNSGHNNEPILDEYRSNNKMKPFAFKIKAAAGAVQSQLGDVNMCFCGACVRVMQKKQNGLSDFVRVTYGF